MTLAILHILAALSVLAWLYLLGLHGRFWRVPADPDAYRVASAEWPQVVAVVPARNEAAVVEAALGSLMAQDYPGEFGIIAVDDQSVDGTRGRMLRVAEAGGARPLDLVAGKKRPPGWTGKLWAVQQGLEAAERLYPGTTFFWLTDADIVHGPGNLRRLVARAEGAGLGLVSQMVRLRSQAAVEKLLIPAFVFFFRKLYPFARVNDPHRRTAAAAGGSMLVRESVLRSADGIAAIAGEVIDDCALARLLKPSAPIRLDLTRDAESLRGYPRLGDVWSMVIRTAFVQLRHSYALLLGTVVGMGVLYLMPPLAVLLGLVLLQPWLAALGVAGWLLMALAYAPMLRFYGLSGFRSLLLPAAALLYVAMTVDSAFRHLRRRAPEWKGRRYPVERG